MASDAGADIGRDTGPDVPRTETELCGDGSDDDRDGRIDEGCPCTPGETQACFLGLPEHRGEGECSEGEMICEDAGAEFSEWGASTCVGSGTSVMQMCQHRDDDCDGQVDEGCACSEGETQACGTDVGACRAGQIVCEGGAWGSCVGALPPAATDRCGDGLDGNCDGVVDEGCACASCGAPVALGEPVIYHERNSRVPDIRRVRYLRTDTHLVALNVQLTGTFPTYTYAYSLSVETLDGTDVVHQPVFLTTSRTSGSEPYSETPIDVLWTGSEILLAMRVNDPLRSVTVRRFDPIGVPLGEPVPILGGPDISAKEVALFPRPDGGVYMASAGCEGDEIYRVAPTGFPSPFDNVVGGCRRTHVWLQEYSADLHPDGERVELFVSRAGGEAFLGNLTATDGVLGVSYFSIWLDEMGQHLITHLTSRRDGVTLGEANYRIDSNTASLSRTSIRLVGGSGEFLMCHRLTPLDEGHCQRYDTSALSLGPRFDVSPYGTVLDLTFTGCDFVAAGIAQDTGSSRQVLQVTQITPGTGARRLVLEEVLDVADRITDDVGIYFEAFDINQALFPRRYFVRTPSDNPSLIVRRYRSYVSSDSFREQIGLRELRCAE